MSGVPGFWCPKSAGGLTLCFTRDLNGKKHETERHEAHNKQIIERLQGTQYLSCRQNITGRPLDRGALSAERMGEDAPFITTCFWPMQIYIYLGK